jgi:hypothetical protein
MMDPCARAGGSPAACPKRDIRAVSSTRSWSANSRRSATLMDAITLRFGASSPASRIRRCIEPVNDTLKGQLDLERHGARTPKASTSRITQRLLPMAPAIWYKGTTAAPATRSPISHDKATL